MIEVQSLNKSFGKKHVLKDVTVSFDNAIYGLLGPNGAGKTTFIRLLSQIYPDKDGSIKFNGNPINKDKHYLTKVGYLPQLFGAFNEMRLFDMMRFISNLKGFYKANSDKDIEKCLKIVNLYDRKDSKVGCLSGGMIRRVGIAQAMLGDPDVIIFDEPTAGLDPEERLRFKNIVAENSMNKTIIISTHIVEDVEALCDKVAIMNDGHILLTGTLSEIKSCAANKVYQIPSDKLSEIKGTYHTLKQTENNGVKEVRFLSNETQHFESVSPTVEDGYICKINAI